MTTAAFPVALDGVRRPWSARATATARLGVRPMALVRATVVLLAVGNLGRLPALWLLGKDLPVLPQELLIVPTLALALAACVQARRLRVDGLLGAAAAFAAVGFGSAVVTAVQLQLEVWEFAYALAYLARWAAYVALYGVIMNTARDDDAEMLWRTLERTVLWFAAFGVVQALLLPGFAQKVFPTDNAAGWDVQGNRLVSTLLDPNLAGAFILPPLLVHIGRMAMGVRVGVWRPLLLIAAVLLTVSRSTLLALAVGIVVVVAAAGVRRPLVRFGAVVAALALPLTPLLIKFANDYDRFSTDGSAAMRWITWARALEVFADHPIFGVGFNTYGYVQASYGWEIIGRDGFTLDGGLLFVAVLTGSVGVAIFLVMLGLAYRRCRRLWRDVGAPAIDRGTALGVGAAIPAICVHSLFANSLLIPSIIEALAVSWGIVFLLGRRRAVARVAGERLPTARSAGAPLAVAPLAAEPV